MALCASLSHSSTDTKDNKHITIKNDSVPFDPVQNTQFFVVEFHPPGFNLLVRF